MKILAVILAMVGCAQAQIYRNPRGAWQAATSYVIGDTFTCSATTYLVVQNYVSGSACGLTNTGAAAPSQVMNYTGVGYLDDNTLASLFPRLNNTLYWIQDHLFDKATYNDLVQVSTPAAPGAGLVRFYVKGNAPCWIYNGGSETCVGGVTTGGDLTGSIGAATVVAIRGRAVANTSPGDLQYLGWNNSLAQWEPKTISGTFYQTVRSNGTAQTQRAGLNLIPGTSMTVTCVDNIGLNATDCTLAASGVTPGGADGDYQRKSGTSFVAGSLKEDTVSVYTTKALQTAAAVVTFSATPVFDTAAGNRIEITLTGNVTSSTWTNRRGGAKYSVAISQDGTGAHTLAWPGGTLNACSPWQVANSVTTVFFEVASDGTTVTATNCSVYDPANPGVVFTGLMRGSIPTPLASNMACGFDSTSTTWKCIAPDASVSTAVKALTVVTHQFVNSLSGNGVLGTAQPDTGDLTTTNPIPGSVDVGTNGYLIEIANAGTTGTTINKLAKLTGAPSTAVISATTDTNGAVGVVVGAAGTTGSAKIARMGQATCAFDGATTAGHYVQISSSVAGDCHDSGAATYPTSGQVIGWVTQTLGSSGNANVLMRPDINASAGGSSAASPSDNTAFSIVEDFTPRGSFTLANLGLYGWSGTQIGSGGCGSVSFAGQNANHPGLIGVTTISTVSTGCAIALDAQNNQTMLPSLATITFTEKWTVVTDATLGVNNFIARFGRGNTMSAVASMTGVHTRVDPTNSANFQIDLWTTTGGVGGTGTTPNFTLDTGVAYDSTATSYTFQWRGDGAKWYWSVSKNGAVFSTPEKTICPSGCDLTAALPTNASSPAMSLAHTSTVDGNQKRFYLDRYSLEIPAGQLVR